MTIAGLKPEGAPERSPIAKPVDAAISAEMALRSRIVLEMFGIPCGQVRDRAYWLPWS
jgi:hypothetical protein